MNKNASNKIPRAILLGTILSALLLAFSETGYASKPTAINSCTEITTSGSYRLVADLTSEAVCITIHASNVDLRLDGHTITGSGAGSLWGILVAAQTNVRIKGPGVITNFAFGVILDGADSSEVTDVIATNNFHGFAVLRDHLTPGVNNSSEENLFRRNTATGNVNRGFFLEGAINNSFLNNVASNNEEGFYVGPGTTGNHFKGNTINENSVWGLRVIGASTGETSTAHTIEDNTANGNGIAGIQLAQGSSGNSVNGNTTLDNFIGISLAGSSGNNVNGNTALSNSFGISIIQDSSGNNVNGNTALNNTVNDLADGSIACDNNIWTNNVFNTANQTCIQ